MYYHELPAVRVLSCGVQKEYGQGLCIVVIWFVYEPFFCLVPGGQHTIRSLVCLLIDRKSVV